MDDFRFQFSTDTCEGHACQVAGTTFNSTGLPYMNCEDIRPAAGRLMMIPGYGKIVGAVRWARSTGENQQPWWRAPNDCVEPLSRYREKVPQTPTRRDSCVEKYPRKIISYPPSIQLIRDIRHPRLLQRSHLCRRHTTASTASDRGGAPHALLFFHGGQLSAQDFTHPPYSRYPRHHAPNLGPMNSDGLVG